MRLTTCYLALSYIALASVVAGQVIALLVTWWKTLGTVREAARLKIKAPLGIVLVREGGFCRPNLGCFIIMLTASLLHYRHAFVTVSEWHSGRRRVDQMWHYRVLLVLDVFQLLSVGGVRFSYIIVLRASTWRINYRGPCNMEILELRFCSRSYTNRYAYTILDVCLTCHYYRLSSTLVCRFMLNLKEAAYHPELCSTLHISTIRFNANVLIGNLGEPLDLAAEHEECTVEEYSLEWDGSTVMPWHSNRFSVIPM